MGQEVSFDLDTAVQQMTAINEVATDIKQIEEQFNGVTSRQVPADWTHENGAVGFANQFRATGDGLGRALLTLQKDMVEMYEELKKTIDEFVANDEEKQARYNALIIKYNLKDIADNLNMAGAAAGAMVGGGGGKTMAV
ncbi:hypothetical protein [Ruania zhangjianzhongii]|uniref:hypothetical protein n=1 Tax=Ruania zhangjianzhongii TaxID=2603206 RepID=UPI0011CAEA95|nr:hypothetical protein [Ruania zhangjianzhongii]